MTDAGEDTDVAIAGTADARVGTRDVLGGGFETELHPSDVEQHIGTAHTIVEEELTGEGMSEDRLARIEMFLARHFIRSGPNRQVEQESVAGMNRSYAGDFNRTFYEATAPGQQALMLDRSNSLGRETMGDFFAVGP